MLNIYVSFECRSNFYFVFKVDDLFEGCIDSIGMNPFRSYSLSNAQEWKSSKIQIQCFEICRWSTRSDQLWNTRN